MDGFEIFTADLSEVRRNQIVICECKNVVNDILGEFEFSIKSASACDKAQFKEALENILICFSWLNFVYKYKKKNSKIPSESGEIIRMLDCGRL